MLIDLSTSLATNDIERQDILEMTIKEQISEWLLRMRNDSFEQHRVNKGKYNLTTKARRKVVGRNKQLDEGAGRQNRKCLDPLNCVAPAAFWKHSTGVQLWHMGANMDLAFLG